MSEKKSFVVRHENIEQFEMLTSEQCGELFLAMCYFSRDGKEPEFSDPLLKLMFSVVRGQLVRDAEKYEDICQKRSENGKKGGAPKGNRNAAKTSKSTNCFSEQAKQTKQAKCEPVPVTVPVTDPVSVCECVPVCEPDAAGADSAAQNFPHTPHTAEDLTVDWVLTFAQSMGFLWSQEEAVKFISFNRERGRTDSWDYAVQRWEEHRFRRSNSGSDKKSGKMQKSADVLRQKEIDEMNGYLSLVNRFMEEDEHEYVQV